MTGAPAVQAPSSALRRHARQRVGEWAARECGSGLSRMRVVRSAYASSASLFNVHLTLRSGERLRLVYKVSGPGAQLPAARGVKPDFVADAGREARMYESVLSSGAAAGAPRLLASGCTDDGGRWLLMEWAGSRDLGQVGARAAWCEAAARLARLHVWGEPRAAGLAAGWLLRWDDPRLHLRLARRARGAQAEHLRAAGLARDPLGPLWRRYGVVAGRLAAMPKTLVHGDFNASNILIARVKAPDRVRVIDWETAGVGPGLLDLASLVSGRLPAGHRAGMVAAYRGNLAGSPLGALTAAEFEDALSWCRLARAVQWLGWSPGWSPPPRHAHDWRGEALALARELGLVGRA